MTILLYESAGVNAFMTVYKDSDDPNLFYYVPQFGTVSKRANGKLNFGAQLFKGDPTNPDDGFAIFNFGVHGVIPNDEYQKMYESLKANYGPDAKLSVISPDAENPKLVPITAGGYDQIKCQAQGVNLYTDLAASFTTKEIFAHDYKNFFQDNRIGWAGEIDFSVRTKKTEFEWTITANWHRMLEHFKSQVSVKYWFVSANLSYETQKLIQNESLKIDITGGTPDQKEKIYTFAEKIAARLFKPTLQPNAMPNHPSGSALCVSVNYQKVEEDKTSVWHGREQDYEVKPLGIAAYVGGIPDEYFGGFDAIGPMWDSDNPIPTFGIADLVAESGTKL